MVFDFIPNCKPYAADYCCQSFVSRAVDTNYEEPRMTKVIALQSFSSQLSKFQFAMFRRIFCDNREPSSPDQLCNSTQTLLPE